MAQIMYATYDSSLTNLCDHNSSFDSGVLHIAYTGANRNGSYISKETFERCINTMYNCPIVCNYDRETDSIGGHDVELVRDSEDNLSLVNITVPIGVIPESSKYFWDTVEEEDGSIHEYLCADVLIWKRQEVYKKIKEDGITAHSMELTVKEGRLEDGLFIIEDFEFTAFCLLGDGHEPCFESSELKMFSYDAFKTQMTQMLCDLKSEIKEVAFTKENTLQGGLDIVKEKNELLAQFGLKAEDLDFGIEDLSIEDLKLKLEDYENHKADPDHTSEDFALNSNLESELRRVVDEKVVERCWGVEHLYWMYDFDAEKMEVYCVDTQDGYKLYGFKYSLNGDNVSIDYDSKRRMKYAIVEFDEGTDTDVTTSAQQTFADICSNYTACAEDLATKNTEWESKYTEMTTTANDMTTTIGEMTEELESLRAFKLTTEENQRIAECEQVFAAFADLEDVDDFIALKDNHSEYSVDELTEKCYAIRGRAKAPDAKFSMTEQKPHKLKVDRSNRTENTCEPYGGLFVKYGIAED